MSGASDFLRPFSGHYEYALVMFDHEGCGREADTPDDLAAELESALARNGWAGRATVIVLAPELEIWAWSRSPHVVRCLGWADRMPPLYDWLTAEGHWPAGAIKPPQPKAAFEAALREVRRPRSSAIYSAIASSVTLQGHTEPSFMRLTKTLRGWFAADRQ